MLHTVVTSALLALFVVDPVVELEVVGLAVVSLWSEIQKMNYYDLRKTWVWHFICNITVKTKQFIKNWIPPLHLLYTWQTFIFLEQINNMSKIQILLPFWSF